MTSIARGARPPSGGPASQPTGWPMRTIRPVRRCDVLSEDADRRGDSSVLTAVRRGDRSTSLHVVPAYRSSTTDAADAASTFRRRGRLRYRRALSLTYTISWIVFDCRPVASSTAASRRPRCSTDGVAAASPPSVTNRRPASVRPSGYQQLTSGAAVAMAAEYSMQPENSLTQINERLV